jgi:dephospho-CoA kinase
MSSRPIESKPVIGIVGGIGAGKSTAAAELVALGCVLVDADAIGHELLGDPQVLDRLRRRWPDGVVGPDGQVDRKALASRVFADPAELEALNGILHPPIRRRMARRIADARKDPAARGVVVDAAVLLEAGWDNLCTHLVFISAPQEDRLRRVSADRGWDPQTWRQREKAQFLLDKKAAKCDYTVDNCSSVSRLCEQIRQLFHQICPDVS